MTRSYVYLAGLVVVLAVAPSINTLSFEPTFDDYHAVSCLPPQAITSHGVVALVLAAAPASFATQPAWAWRTVPLGTHTTLAHAIVLRKQLFGKNACV